MDIKSIKQLMKDGDFSQARELLDGYLAQTSGDEVAQMLYGTCCQIMGDTETFGSIYQRLAPKMQRCVDSGEQSERVAMWVKYAAMFAMLLMCGCGTQHRVGGNYYATLDDAKAPLAVMPTSDENGEFSRLLKMSLKEKFHYFLERQDVKEQLYRGAMRAVVIPL